MTKSTVLTVLVIISDIPGLSHTALMYTFKQFGTLNSLRCMSDDAECRIKVNFVEPVTTPATPTSTEPSLEMPKPPTEGKGSKKTSASKKKKKQKEKPEPQSQKMEIDLDPENKNKKRVYRALDTMVLCSATGLFLVLILVLNNEFFKSSALTIVYAVFVYIWSGQWWWSY